jgi:hypothetical protein
VTVAAAVAVVGILALLAGFVLVRGRAGGERAAASVALGAASATASSSASSPAPSQAGGTPVAGSSGCGAWDCAQRQRFAAAETFLARQPGYLGIVVRDRRTGATWRAGVTDHLIWTASTTKLGMVVSLLERARAGQLALDATARAQIADMLNWSSDQAADALWNRYGGEAFIPRFQSTYGMAKLTFVAGYARRWGHMKCTPDDLLALMSYITDTLNPTDRAYVMGAMQSVGPIQQWGVWGAGPAMHPGNKDGWSVEPDDGGRHWVANSVGFAGPDQRYLVAVMYQLPASVPTTAAGVHTGAHAVSDLVATVFGSPVPAMVTVPDHE